MFSVFKKIKITLPDSPYPLPSFAKLFVGWKFLAEPTEDTLQLCVIPWFHVLNLRKFSI